MDRVPLPRPARRRNTRARMEEILTWWNPCFLISCAFAVFIDPIFCYIQAIDDQHKCISIDQKLAVAYISVRSLSDAIYLMDIIIFKYAADGSLRSDPLSTILRIFVSLPISQVMVILFLQHGPANKHFYYLTTPFQFFLRIYLIYGMLKKRLTIDITRARWLKAILDFVPFILASHLFGAFWHHLVIHSQTECWMSTYHQIYPQDFHFDLSSSGPHVACKANRSDTYYPGSNISRWDDLCPVAQADPKVFDFGIFLNALQSDLVSSRNSLALRIFQSFWWGLRNLSSFGSNLNTSMDLFEILFSFAISISGMALFLVYLNARLQETQERSNERHLNRRTQLRRPYVDFWFAKNNIPTDMKTLTTKNYKELKTVIMENIHRLDENSVLNTQSILSILTTMDRKNLMWKLYGPVILRTVPELGNNENVLKAICQHLMPVTYTADDCIVREGKPIGKMLLIDDGIAVEYSNVGTSCGCSRNKKLVKGDFYCRELLNWAFAAPSESDLPISTRNVIAQGRVEAFYITATDLKSILVRLWFISRESTLNASQLRQWKHRAVSVMQAAWHRRRQARMLLAAPVFEHPAGLPVPHLIGGDVP